MKKQKNQLTYEGRVFKALYDMQEGSKAVEDFCNPKVKEAFMKSESQKISIETVKKYIDRGTINGYDLYFNSDYSRIIKIDIMLRTEADKFKEG